MYINCCVKSIEMSSVSNLQINQVIQSIQNIDLNPESHKLQPFVLSGCSGAGKGTLVKYLLDKYPDIFKLSVSYTTRKPRPGEVHGREYYFVDVDQFLSQAEKGGFVQYGQIYGNYYATHKGQVERIINMGKICILEIDLKAAQKIYKETPDYNFLFLNVPHIQVLRQRMRKRGTQKQQVIERRMAHSIFELEKIKELNFYEQILNQDLDQTKEKLIDYINKRYNLSLDA